MAKANPFRFSTKFQDDEADVLYYGYRNYNPSVGRWLIRDPIEEEGGGNLFAFLGNDPADDLDELGLCSPFCKCKQVGVTFDPGGKTLRPGFYDTPLGPRFGAYIIVAWALEDGSDPTLCQYFAKEPAGGATFTFPSGRKATSEGTGDQWQPVLQVWYDATGVFVSDQGNYKGKYKLTQTYKCVSSDGSEKVVGPRTYKASAATVWPPKGKK